MTRPHEQTSLVNGASSTIFISDMDRAVQFYTESIGLRVLYRAGDEFTMIDAGAGTMLGLHPPGRTTPPPGTAGSIEVGLNVVGSIEDAVATLEARGVRFKDFGSGPIIDDGAVKLAYFGDQDGNTLYLCEVVQA